MFDRVKLKIHDVEEHYIYQYATIFFTDINPKGANDLTFRFKNLKCFYSSYNNLVEIDGSLHKFKMGNNYCDYSYTELVSTFELISKAFDTSLENIRITFIEIGVNLTLSHPAKGYYDCFRSLHRNTFIPMNPIPGIAKIHGCRCYATSMEIKLYDKTFEVTHGRNAIKKCLVPDNILRVEVCLRSNYLSRNRMIYTAHQIVHNKRIFLRIMRKLKNYCRESIRVNTYSVDQLKRSGIKASVVKCYLLITSDNFKKHREYLSGSSISLKQDIARCKKVMNELASIIIAHNFIQELDDCMRDKCKQLIV